MPANDNLIGSLFLATVRNNTSKMVTFSGPERVNILANMERVQFAAIW